MKENIKIDKHLMIVGVINTMFAILCFIFLTQNILFLFIGVLNLWVGVSCLLSSNLLQKMIDKDEEFD